ncbi:hypothetical protein Scep_026208 [Stephania cephalantha]|uniref:Uncharacterized protein n=1 Tax=Stephania cephalantha TaxID=152367 RepID=A0AAP0HQ56_9MAGN
MRVIARRKHAGDREGRWRVQRELPSVDRRSAAGSRSRAKGGRKRRRGAKRENAGELLDGRADGRPAENARGLAVARGRNGRARLWQQQ